MAMIEFVRNYSDLSTDRGYQFEFRCDHCANGYMSSYQASLIGTAGGLLQAAGNIFGGLLGSAGSSSYEIQRAIGGPAHDRALQQAVAEVKQKFRRCQRCGNWVCAEICWNEQAAQCTGCTPKYEQEAISLRTQAQVSATRQQMLEKAQGTDYVSGIDMRPDAEVHFLPGGHAAQLPGGLAGAGQGAGQLAEQGLGQGAAAAVQSQPAAAPVPWTPVAAAHGGAACTACGAALTGGKFCAECGAPAAAPGPRTCAACGHLSAATARFCEECGGRLT